MNIELPKLGKGLTQNSNGEITLNFADDTPVQKKDDGVYIPKDSFGDGTDGWTVKIDGVDAKGNARLNINRDVVVSIFTMSRRKVSDRANVENYSTSDTTKVVEDIVDEFNCAMDNYATLGQSVPEGLPATQFVLTVGDFIQFRENARPWRATLNGEKGPMWPCAMDDMRRYQEDPIRAFFYITDVKYQDVNLPQYLTKLTILCVWSELPEYVAGTSYTYQKP